MTNQKTRIEKALNNFPEEISSLLIKKADYPYSFLPATIVAELCNLSNKDLNNFALDLLPLASAFSEAPISNFFVGAVAVDSANNAYLGANFEFKDTHIGQTIHAEQSAIAHAWSRNAKDLALLVINYAPCGHCRQFINEVNLSKNFQILLPGSEPKPLSAYLPNAFGPADLDITNRILNHEENIAVKSDLFSIVNTACSNSHAPYSQSYSSVGLQFEDNEIVLGKYAENAAFNPSLPPLQMALNYRRLKGENWKSIKRILMCEKKAMLSQKANTQALIKHINENILFEYLQVD